MICSVEQKSSTHTNGSVEQIELIGNIGIVGNGHSQKTESRVELLGQNCSRPSSAHLSSTS